MYQHVSSKSAIRVAQAVLINRIQYMRLLALRASYHKIRKRDATPRSVNAFWTTLLHLYFRDDDIDLGYGMKELSPPPILLESSDRYRIREVRNYLNYRALISIEDQHRIHDIRADDWEAALDYLTAYMKGMRQAGGETRDYDRYGQVCIGLWTRFYVLRVGQEVCRDFGGVEEGRTGPWEVNRDEGIIHDVLTELATSMLRRMGGEDGDGRARELGGAVVETGAE